jgi:hypothetical protein
MSGGTVVLDEMIMAVTSVRLVGGAFNIQGKLFVSRPIPKGTVLHGAVVHGSDGELVANIPDLQITVPTKCRPGDELRLDLDVDLDNKTAQA